MKSNWLILGGFALILVLPLLNLPPWFAPPEWSKAVVFRALGFLGIAGLGLALLLGRAPLAPLKKAFQSQRGLLLLLGGYLGVLLLSTLLSSNVQQGLLGVPLRGGGVVDFLLLFSFTVALLAFMKEQGWNTLWKVAISTGAFVALVALFQQFSSFSEVFVTGVSRPGSTVGGPAFLASYLLLLLFPSLAFGLQNSRFWTKLPYLGAAALFAAVIILGLTRGAYLALFLGLAWLIGWYPKPHRYRKVLKILIAAVALIGVLSIGYLNVAQLPEPLQDNQFFSGFHARLQLESLLEARYGTWVIAWEAVKNQPLLGYGWENSLVGLNKSFDPSLPGVSNPSEGWWLDRGHNIVLDALLAGGVVALALFVLFLFSLFRKLQASKKDAPSRAVFLHSIQALLIAYVAANLTSFDSFSISLLLFFVIAWALWLISPPPVENLVRLSFPQGARIVGTTVIPVALFLVWQLSVSPLLANAKVNQATEISDDVRQCQAAISLFDSLDQQEHLRIMETHVKGQYANAINRCIQRDPKLSSLRIKQYQLLKEVVEARPEHAESWITFGGLATNVAEQAVNQNQQDIAGQLLEEAQNAFLAAEELSPKRPGLFERWSVKELVAGNYQNASEKAQACLALDEGNAACWWWKGIAELLLQNPEAAKQALSSAEEKGYRIGPAELGQLARAYAAAQQYEKAREAAEELLERQPENREQIEAFLNALPR